MEPEQVLEATGVLAVDRDMGPQQGPETLQRNPQVREAMVAGRQRLETMDAEAEVAQVRLAAQEHPPPEEMEETELLLALREHLSPVVAVEEAEPMPEALRERAAREVGAMLEAQARATPIRRVPTEEQTSVVEAAVHIVLPMYRHLLQPEATGGLEWLLSNIQIRSPSPTPVAD